MNSRLSSSSRKVLSFMYRISSVLSSIGSLSSGQLWILMPLGSGSVGGSEGESGAMFFCDPVIVPRLVCLPRSLHPQTVLLRKLDDLFRRRSQQMDHPGRDP